MLSGAPDSPTPQISVLMITYNHEKYIEQAVRSVMMQHTNFTYELVIGEDCSTDQTRTILEHLQREFPEKIRLLLPEQNLGMIRNFIATYNACQGEFIAICEGDDYWTSPHKLQTQVEYLISHPECRFCFHPTEIVYEDKPDVREEMRPPVDAKISLRGWLEARAKYGKGYIATGSVVLRTPTRKLPEWFSELREMGDWPLFLWLDSIGGSLDYIDGVTLGTYRRNAGSVSFSRSQRQLITWINDFLLLRDHLPMYWPLLKPIVARVSLSIATNFANTHEESKAKPYFWMAVNLSKPSELLKAGRRYIRPFIRLYMPLLDRLYCRLRTGSARR